MSVFLLASMGLNLLVLGLLYFFGADHVRGKTGPQRRAGRTPKLALIVPMTGSSPAMRDYLASLLDQEYPHFEALFVTADENDPAWELAGTFAAADARVTRLTAGLATTCGQKNHNILAALEKISRDVEILVFCDSGHRARRDFLRELAGPIIRGDAVLAGGFHRVVPLDGRVSTIGMLVTCLALHLMQPIRQITQPWGGAMAMSREAFERYDVRSVWAVNIVDDFSLGPFMHRYKIICWPVALACLETPVGGRTLRMWNDWLTRQLLYLKFCIPPGWIAATAGVWILSGPAAASLAILGASVLGLASTQAVTAAVVYLAAFAGSGLLFRRLSPRPVAVLPWLRGYLATFLMLAWCFGRTFTTNTMRWRGIAYRVGYGGKVRQIIRETPPA